MPYTTQIIDGGTGILRKGTGVVTGAEILAANRQIHSLEIDLAALTHVLVDFEEAADLQLTSEETRLIAQQIQDNVDAGVWKTLHVAIAAASDLAFGMSRMFSVFAENGAVKVSAFRTMGEARAWIAGELALPPASSTRTL